MYLTDSAWTRTRSRSVEYQNTRHKRIVENNTRLRVGATCVWRIQLNMVAHANVLEARHVLTNPASLEVVPLHECNRAGPPGGAAAYCGDFGPALGVLPQMACRDSFPPSYLSSLGYGGGGTAHGEKMHKCSSLGWRRLCQDCLTLVAV